MRNDVIVFEINEQDKTLHVRLIGEDVWLTQAQIADIFGVDRSVVTKHISNIFKLVELEEESNVQILHIPNSDKPVRHYGLDVILAVGYRVNAKKGIEFRRWANNILKDHLTQGYTLNEQRLKANMDELETALSLIKKTSQSNELTLDTGRGLVDIVTRYAQTFLWLQRYDEGLLTDPLTQAGGVLPSYQEAIDALINFKQSLIAKGEASELFARERDDTFAGLLGNLDQSVFGDPAYPSIESKAAHLLYFVIKNHPFADGNKRSGAFLFIDFLHRNGRLLDTSGIPIINDIGMAAIALLVAESNPDHKETMIRLIMNMISLPEQRGKHEVQGDLRGLNHPVRQA